MRLVDALIAELLTDFVDPFVASDDQHLQEQFWGDAHDHVLVEIVMVSFEGFGGGPAGDQVHHRGFDLEEPQVVQKRLDLFDDQGPLQENVSRAVVHDQVEVSLTVPRFFVLQACLLRGKHVQAR